MSELLQDSIRRVEAILRDHGFHEPSCPTRRTQRLQRGSTLHYVPPACTCWLSTPEEPS